MAKLAKLSTIGDFNRVWTEFTRQFPPGSPDDISRIHPYFGKLADQFSQCFRKGINKIDAFDQDLSLSADLAQACEEWREVVKQTTGRIYL